ncbi:exocyst complex component 2-like [Paramacrobiotus metropolitanus]|uniref:exocyst complex component 2-like n=1 Tax=Paramacrobiotus metropolitanus TaxID=2943436 RepID=UPI00244642A8|nr:exocyst complex component 2-like [Paramacrobiotus metropolitanus]
MVRAPPKVTGLSPKEGPPGTRIVIRGENFGAQPNDLISVLICGAECVFQAEWQSPSKILCRSGNGQGIGDVVITTKSGGRGTSTVQFRGYVDSIGPTKESAVWIDESRFADGRAGNQPQSPVGLAEGQDPLALSDEQTKEIFKEEQLLEMFPEGSGNITQENFNSAWFLLENHGGATLEDLKHGLRHMQTQSKQQSEGSVVFLKGHLGSYFECIDTLDHLEVRFAEDSEKFVENVDSLVEKVSNARDLSNYTYEAVFRRRQKTEFYRHSISTVQRFHYFFDLLSSIHKSIRLRNYRAIMADFRKFQSMIGKSQVRVLQNVYREVEAKIDSLRSSLREELRVMPGDVDKQIMLCRNLAELEDTGDPGWDCINTLHLYIMEKMFEIYSFYFADVGAAVADVQRSLQTKAYLHIDFQIHVASPFDLDFDVPSDIEGATSVNREKPEAITDSASVCQLLKVLSDHMVKGVRHFLRLSEAFFQSEMRESGKDVTAVVDPVKYNRQREMVVETVHNFVAIVQCAVRPKETLIKPEDFYSAVLAIQDVRKALTGHGEGAAVLKQLIMQLKRALVLAVLERGAAEMESIATNASERPDKVLRLASKMPELFTTIAVKTLGMTKQYLAEDKIHNINILNDSALVDAILNNWTRLFNVPVDTLHDFGDSGTGVVALFALMSAQTLLKKVLPRLFKMLDSNIPESKASFKVTITDRYNELVSDLAKSFVETKAEPVIGVIEKHMIDYGVDWKHASEPQEVNAYITRIAFDLNAVYEELCVFVSDEDLSDNIMKGIIVKVCEEVNRLFFVASGFNVNGVIQGQIDLAALRLIIGPFTSRVSTTMLDDVDKLLRDQRTPQSGDKVNKVLDEYTRTHQMLMFS